MTNQNNEDIWSHFNLEPHQANRNPPFKIKSGQTSIEFISEPRYWFDALNKVHTIVVDIRANGQDHPWFIKDRQYVLLKGIKAMCMSGKITGRRAIIGRMGEGRGNTRYTFTEVMDA